LGFQHNKKDWVFFERSDKYLVKSAGNISQQGKDPNRCLLLWKDLKEQLEL